MRNIKYAKTEKASSPSNYDLEALMEYLHDNADNKDVDALVAAVKKNYVDKRHHRAISFLKNASGYKTNCWKTYVYFEGRRKEILRRTEEELYDALYEFYKAQEEGSRTLAVVYNCLKKYKTDVKNVVYHTTEEDDRYFSYLSKDLTDCAISKITEDDICLWLKDDFLQTRRKISALKKMFQLLNQIFNYGIRENLCLINPLEKIDIKSFYRSCDTKKSPEAQAFSAEEIRILRKEARQHPDNPHALMMLFSMETGVRADEMPPLLKTDIENGYIHIHRQQRLDRASGHQKFCFLDYTKDERRYPHDGRRIPITPACQEVLELAYSLPGESPYVFHNKNGEYTLKTSYMQYLRRQCLDLGLSATNNHAIRKAYNRRLINLGLSSSDRALILGHSVETNERNYSLTDNRRLEKIKAKMIHHGNTLTE